MHSVKPVFFLLWVVICVAGCKKDENAYKLVNETGVTISFSLYQDIDDYALSKNPIVSGHVEKDRTLVIPSTKTNGFKSCYIDWYSDDFTYSNWLVDGGNIVSNGTNNIKAVPKIYLRPAFLAGNSASSWKTIDVLNSSYFSIYDQSIYYNSLEIVINKLEMQLFRKDSNGHTNVRAVTLDPMGHAGDYDLGTINDAVYLAGKVPIPPVHNSTGDTIVYLNNSIYYLLVKK